MKRLRPIRIDYRKFSEKIAESAVSLDAVKDYMLTNYGIEYVLGSTYDYVVDYELFSLFMLEYGEFVEFV